jgi:hypothetical protein
MRVQIGGPTNGERTIARVNAAGGHVIECGKDGACMFHSFLVSAILNPALEPAVSRPRFSVGESACANAFMAQMQRVTAKGLRACVVDEMTMDWPRYSPFIEERLHADYLARMTRSSEYADHPELIALSQVCGMTIHVWGAENTAIISANQDAPGSLPIVNLAHRDTGDSRDHYWAVLLPPPPPPSVQLP